MLSFFLSPVERFFSFEKSFEGIGFDSYFLHLLQCHWDSGPHRDYGTHRVYVPCKMGLLFITSEMCTGSDSICSRLTITFFSVIIVVLADIAAVFTSTPVVLYTNCAIAGGPVPFTLGLETSSSPLQSALLLG